MDRLSWAELTLARSVSSQLDLSIDSFICSFIQHIFEAFFFFLLGTVPGAGSIAAKGIESEFGCGDSLETEGLSEELDISRDPNQPANTKLKV